MQNGKTEARRRTKVRRVVRFSRSIYALCANSAGQDREDSDVERANQTRSCTKVLREVRFARSFKY